MKFAVTGGAGFIGSHIAESLLQNKHSVIIIDNLDNGTLKNLKKIRHEIEFFKIDILDFDKMKKTLKNVDGVFHLAGLTSVVESFCKPKKYHAVNVKGTENIFKIADMFNLKVVFASSASVYGKPKKIPIKENFQRKPISPYGITKMKDEILADEYVKKGAIIVGLRYFNVFGPRQNNSYAGVVRKFSENIVNGTPPIIFGDGSQIRDFVFVDDAVQATLLTMKIRSTPPFMNIGSGIAISIEDLANAMIRYSGSKIQPMYKNQLESDVLMSQADISLAKKVLGWKPKTSLKDWLQQIFVQRHSLIKKILDS